MICSLPLFRSRNIPVWPKGRSPLRSRSRSRRTAPGSRPVDARSPAGFRSSAVEPRASPRRRTDRPRRPTPPVRAPPSWRRASAGPNPVRWLASNVAPGCEPRSGPPPGGAQGCRGWQGSAPDRGGAECPRRRRHGHGVECAAPERLRSSPRRRGPPFNKARRPSTIFEGHWLRLARVRLRTLPASR